MQMNIRRLGAEDARAFRELRLEGLKMHPEAFGASFDDELAQPLERAAARLAENVVLGGFDAAGALQGIIGLRREKAAKIRHRAGIWGMYVAPSARGTGLAKNLLQAAINEAMVDCQSVLLSVTASNEAAKRLYQRAGFREWAVDRKALCVEGAFVDEVLMRLDFA
ncbi:GNAT family N-acetyltransferase [uncultured Nitratireductor sp.]|uniref:GNAT family N-acetyltransferase n=1 Tax=Nitratireductor sp. PBL-C9 TaxID=3435013 RepID=UPI0026307159|nr:GNAT family N-acetyltransferase [uncultured Nitratireductor sp.]